MTLEELTRIEAKALDQAGVALATTIALTPGQLIELCRLARIGQSKEQPERENVQE